MKGMQIIGVLVVIGGIGLFLLSNTGSQPDVESSVSFSATLPVLSEGHYEGWAIYGDEKVSTGKFDAGSEVFTLERNLEDADMVVVTIEAEGDTDTEPSGVVVLAGEVGESNTVALSFPVDLSNVSGSYILATPTNGNGNNETSGVWFVQLPPPLSASLNLPELPSGWVYEGWAVNGGTPLTTGRFSDVAAADDFNDFSGTDAPGPNFPGEDFIRNAPEGSTFPVDLADGESLVVVSVEPDIDGVDPTGPAPFDLKPLVDMIPLGAADHTNIELDVDLSGIPSGTVQFN